MRTKKEIKDRLREIESQPIFSSEDKGKWKALVWTLDGKREKPWSENETFNEYGEGRS